MAKEEFIEKNVGVEPLEMNGPILLEMAAGEIKDFLFNPVDGDPFGADRFTLDQLKERFFAQPKENIIAPITPSAFSEAMVFLCEQGLLGFDEKTGTYYNKESA